MLLRVLMFRALAGLRFEPAKGVAAVLLPALTASLVLTHLVTGGMSRQPHTPPELVAALSPPTERSQVLSNEDWMNSIKSDTYWRGRRSGSSAPPPMPLGAGATPPGSRLWSSDEDWSSARFGSGVYRTMCVRLCDGSFFPVSYGTTPDRFELDQESCRSSCPGTPARLFVVPSSGVEVDDMRDLDGKAYRKLRTAFLFRTTYDASCKCKPHPWEQEATARHQSFAAAESKPARAVATDRIAVKAPAHQPALRPLVIEIAGVGGVPVGQASTVERTTERNPRAVAASALTLVNGPQAVAAAAALRASAPAIKPAAEQVAFTAPEAAPHQRRPGRQIATDSKPAPASAPASIPTPAAQIVLVEGTQPAGRKSPASPALASAPVPGQPKVMRLGAPQPPPAPPARAKGVASDWKSRVLFAN